MLGEKHQKNLLLFHDLLETFPKGFNPFYCFNVYRRVTMSEFLMTLVGLRATLNTKWSAEN